jgi:hypothetical protein
VEHCTHCGHGHVSYNSCRNRHCPKCQNTNREVWIRQIEELLPRGNYFHVVFTLPESLNPLFIAFQKEMQNILFRSAWQTVEHFARIPVYPGGKTGMIAVLHTWGQTPVLHPHLHCIVPDSGLDSQGRWINGKKVDNRSTFLFPVRQMSVMFRGKFLGAMSGMLKEKSDVKVPTIKEKVFNVYAKPPFRGIDGVVRYLGCYTHKIAITNHRIENIDSEGVVFRYKDYRDHAKEKRMHLAGEEFLRRFCLHIQGKGFKRIRAYGILSPSNRPVLNDIRRSLGQKPVCVRVKKKYIELAKQIWDCDPGLCPRCKIGRMEITCRPEARPPPLPTEAKTSLD